MTKPKQSHKKQKPDTKWKKTSTVLKDIAVSHVAIDDLEIRPKPYDTEFLVVVIIDAIPAEIMFTNALKEANRLAKEILRDYRSKKNLHVSIWEWTEDRYLKRKGWLS